MSNTFLSKIHVLKLLMSRKLIFYFVLSLICGVSLGFVELGFGVALQNFASQYGLVTAFTGYDFLKNFNPVAFLVCIALIRTFFHFLSSLLPHITFGAITTRMRQLIVNIGLKEKDTLPMTVAECSTFLSDIIPKAANFFSFSLTIIINFLLVLVIIVSMFVFSKTLTVFAVIFGFVVFLPGYLFKGIYHKYSAEVYRLTNIFIGKLLKNLRNKYYLKIVGTIKEENKKILDINERIFQNVFKYSLGITTNTAFPHLAVIFAVIGIIHFNYAHKLLSSNQILAYMYLLLRLSAAVAQLILSYGHLRFNRIFAKDIFHLARNYFTEEASSGISKKLVDVVPNKLEVRNGSFGWKSPLIEDINFTIQKGQFLIISGESGVGKTTLLMSLVGIVPHLKGDVRWNDIAVEDIDQVLFRRRIGYSGADPFLVDGTIRDNLFYGQTSILVSDNELAEILKITRCDFIQNMPGRSDHMLREGGEGISAGQKQRISLARALLSRPSVLILDEATANIDIDTEHKIMSDILAKYKDLITIAVSHRDSLAKFADISVRL